MSPRSVPQVPESLARLDAVPAYLRRLRAHFAESRAKGDEARIREWILDNDYLVRREVRQIREDMPAAFYRRLVPAGGKGEARSCALARRHLRRTALHVDVELLARDLVEHQSHEPLQMGEIWALPPMLRLGLLEELIGVFARLQPGIPPPFAPPEAGASGAEEHDAAEEVPDLETVARCLRSLRLVSATDWRAFFERVSLVERALEGDPSGAYARMDAATRDRYRKVVEEIARAGGGEEPAVAAEAVACARATEARNARARHVGHWLVDAGRVALEAKCGYRPPWRLRIARALRPHRVPLFLAAVTAATLAIWLLPVAYLVANGAAGGPLALGALLALLPASTLAVAFVQWCVTARGSARTLPRMDYEEGIPARQRTLVVVPTLLGGPDEVRSLVRQLEVYYLANPDPQLGFALLTDHLDAPREHQDGDDELLEQAVAGVQLLNRKHGRNGRGPFHLLHRKRRWNPSEGCWMGWERKRGKLEECNRLLRGDRGTTFRRHEGDPEGLEGVRNVITLDADTALPQGTAAQLVGILAHPLNRAVRDPDTGRVTDGYTVIQPRAEISPGSGLRSAFTRIYAGDTSVDIYTHAVSDLYQDLFGDGIFVGKGIYDVDGFMEGLEGRVPDNALLSHDLFEGLHGRVGLATDVVVYEDYPPHYLAYAHRMHRWIRGDWQLLPWLRRMVPASDGSVTPTRFGALARWKILDNLRRSLLPPALLAFLIAGWTILPGHPLAWTLLALLTTAGHIFVGALPAVFRWRRRAPRRRRTALVPRRLREDVGRWAYAWVMLPFEAWVAADAISRTLWRVFVSRRRLLLWRSAAHSVRVLGRHGPHQLVWRKMAAAPVAAVATAAAILAMQPISLAVAAPVLLCWLLAPEVAHGTSRPRRRRPQLSAAEDQRLRLVARRTWLFFEAFVGPEDQWLPPDNFQEDPPVGAAHRTSPTNVGMLLLGTASAYDLGHLTATETAFRFRNTLNTLDRMERHRGHLLNWYDTRSLAPLEPRYVSTVDSGNLAASLLVVRGACGEIATAPLARTAQWDALRDDLLLLQEAVDRFPVDRLHEAFDGLRLWIEDALERVAEAQRDPGSAAGIHRRLCREGCEELDRHLLAGLRGGTEPADLAALHELRTWAEQVIRHLRSLEREWEAFAPWLWMLEEAPAAVREAGAPWHRLCKALDAAPTLDRVPERCRAGREAVPALRAACGAEAGAARGPGEQARQWLDRLDERLEAASVDARRLRDELLHIGARAESQVRGMDFAFLYDRPRKLFRIGFDVSAGRLDPNHYDLLASEARIASMVAIGKGDVPTKHWFHLGRPATRIGGSTALLSWGGSLFEYLMPALFMAHQPNTFLGVSCRAAVEANRRRGKAASSPWGVSESGFATFDSEHRYQYRSFGVPGLGFRLGLTQDHVVAPYASLLALPVAPRAVAENLRRFEALDMVGIYGLYEALDRTPDRLPEGRNHVPVRSYMAHHQGMILAALDNHLAGGAIVRRFLADAMIESTAFFLHEQLPGAIPVESPQEEGLPAPAPPEEDESDPGWSAWEPASGGVLPQVHALGNGRLASVHTDGGGGWISWFNRLVTRRAEDPMREGVHGGLFLRDEDDGAAWAVGGAPGDPRHGERSVVFHPHMVEVFRRNAGIAVRTEVCVAPGADVEVRRLHLTNEGNRPRRLTLTSWTDPALMPAADALRHPAFDRLFLWSRRIEEPEGLVLRRRPRAAGEKPMVVFQGLVAEDEDAARFESWETDRGRFLGRNGDPAEPAAQQPGATLSGRTGFTLDPCLALRARIRLGPGEETRLALVTSAASGIRKAVDAARPYCGLRRVDWALQDAAVEARRELSRCGLPAGDLPALQRLLSLLVHPSERGGAAAAGPAPAQQELWRYGISGDLPILLCEQRSDDDLGLLETLLRAGILWRGRGVRVDLVVLLEGAGGYEPDPQGRMNRLFEHTGARELLGRDGGVFVVYRDQVDPAARGLLAAAARVTLSSRGPSLDAQIASCEPAVAELPHFVSSAVEEAAAEARGEGVGEAGAGGRGEAPEPLLLENGIGGFTRDGTEYVMRLPSGAGTPAPWANVLANPEFGCLVTEAGFGCTWAGNSARFRLTPWRNDPVLDEPSEVLYLRDEETGAVWTPTPRPAPAGGDYEVRHGIGTTRWLRRGDGLSESCRVWVAPGDPVKVVEWRVHNRGRRHRRLTATYFADWVLGEHPGATAGRVTTSFDAPRSSLRAQCGWNAAHAGRTAFLASVPRAHVWTTDRAEFLGRGRGWARPAALERIALGGHAGRPGDACGALQVAVDLEPGETAHVTFLLGAGADATAADALVDAWRTPERRREGFAALGDHWDRILGAVQVETPEPAMNLMLNRWLPYQAASARLFGRSGFYQSSGAFGFRDQLQDVLALLWGAPELAREHLLRAAERQFPEGDVLHWWHPQAGDGVRTRCSDDLLWLPFVVSCYVRATGDEAVLAQPVPWLEGDPLADGESQRYAVFPSGATPTADLMEHCRRALRRGLTAGRRGLPLMGTGDWNDGMDRVGEAGRGESVWLAWFCCAAADGFAGMCERVGEEREAEEWRERARALRRRIEEVAWDGDRYLRAWDDSGRAIGAREAAEARLDSIAQSWAVLAGGMDAGRRRTALESAWRGLVREEEGLALLLDPPFTGMEFEPGYIRSYPPGVRENGGQYTHAAAWLALAFAEEGDADRAFALFRMLLPTRHTATREDCERYRVEPYVVAADVCSAEGNLGRGGWTWYTGAAAWLWRAGVEGILGMRLEEGKLRVDPRLPSGWAGYRATVRTARGTFEVRVTRDEASGASHEGGAEAGAAHRVTVQPVEELGSAR